MLVFILRHACVHPAACLCSSCGMLVFILGHACVHRVVLILNSTFLTMLKEKTKRSHWQC
jgi:hypothetical protein